MIAGKQTTVIIPALNESRSIGRVLAEIPGEIDHIAVVDNGSTDNTDLIAKSYGATVVYENTRGYGAACLAGIASVVNADLIAFIDADYSDFPEDLMKVIEPVASGRFEFAIGCRQSENTDSVDLPFHQRWGNWIACCIIHMLHGFKYNDLGPMRCINLELLNKLEMSDTDYGWTTEMQIKASKMGVDVLQVPVRYRQRIGKSKISGTLKGSVMAGYKILYWTIRLTPSRQKLFNSR